MKRTNKLLSLFLTLALVCGLITPAMAADGTTAQEGKIVILHTNDVHCGIDQTTKDEAITGIGYAGVAAYKAEMEAEYGADNVTLVDAGDAIQGGTIGTLSKGADIVAIMNKVGYDIAIPGNHEFDYGMDQLLSLVKDSAEYDYLCSNFTDLEGNPVFDSYKILTYGDVKVGYVGIDTPESFTKSTPTYFQNEKGEYIYSFQQGNEGKDLYNAVQKAVDAAKKDGADYVVAIAHLGDNGSTDVWKASAVVANTTGIDVIIDGHSHEEIEKEITNKDGETVLWAQTGTKLANIGKVVIDTKTGEISCELVSGYDKQDETVAAFVAEINAKFEDTLKKVVAKTDVALTTLDPESGERAVRSAETNLGDLCADAYRIMLGSDIAFVNGGGVRADIKAGDITYSDIISVHPFGNEACMVETDGQHILDALEMGARLLPEENGGFLQVSGLTYTVDTSIPSSVVLNDENEFVKVEGDYRVKDVKVNGEDLDLTKTYTLASHNYMLKSGGDGFVMFKDAKLIKDCVMVDNQVLINYIVDELKGVVGEDYADPKGQGRITVLKSADKPDVLESFGDLKENAWYLDAVRYVAENGIMNGTKENTFAPEGTVTRGTVYQTLYNMAGKPAVNEAASFNDVSGKWYADAAAWAEDEGLTTGTGKGAFSGDRAMTRQELAKVFAEYAAKKNILPGDAADLSAFTDVDAVASWAKDGMTAAVSLGIIKGSGNKLNPTGTAQRVELAQILMNFSTLKPEEKPEEPEVLKVAMVIPGKIDDGGFMQGGYEGLMKIKETYGAEVEYIADVEATNEALTAAIEKLAEGKPDMLMAHGGQCAEAMQAMSEKYPDIAFVVLHGNVSGDNISSYGVVQEQAAYLAGAAAGLLTETDVVGHMSGLRVPAGVKARGAFADGLKRTNPDAKFLTNFSGNLNDQDLAYRIANAEIEAGADIIFAMLNDGMPGVTKAVVEKKIHQVADSKNRTADEPDVFMISAISDVSMSAFTAATDYVNGDYKPGVIRSIGIETEGAIDVALAPYVSDEVKTQIEAIKQELKDGKIEINVEYTGEEFVPEGTTLKVAMLIPGAIDDGGYYQAGYEGLMRIKNELGAEVTYVNNIPTEMKDLTAALRKLAEGKPDMILSHGGITAAAVEEVSKEYPDIQFVLSQGNVHGPNLSVYQVNYDQATWLCGAAAGLLTESDVVGHISGVRVAGGVNARGAFSNGLAYTNPDAKFLTTFTGDLNDAALAKKTVEAQIDQGVDIIFAMLNDAMSGVTEAVKEHEIRQVADVYDLSAKEPDVYVLSALEDIGMGLFEAAKSYQAGNFESNVVKSFGLETEGAVGIAFAADVPEEVRTQIEALRDKIISGEIEVSNEFKGEEFKLAE
ncbi:MAG: BMP family ABC transporter substrate-binding protein [Oscillospiraceae bacterium]|nr:BMP family ABC transporter substrate-binding protein [Oscillospiraceae bacterium]